VLILKSKVPMRRNIVKSGVKSSTRECRERLIILFVNRKINCWFWNLIGRVKNKGVAMMEDMKGVTVMEDTKGKWLTLMVKDMNDLTKSLCKSKENKI